MQNLFSFRFFNKANRHTAGVEHHRVTWTIFFLFVWICLVKQPLMNVAFDAKDAPWLLAGLLAIFALGLLCFVLRPCHTSRLTERRHNGKANHRLGLPVKNQLNNLPIGWNHRAYPTELFNSNRFSLMVLSTKYFPCKHLRYIAGPDPFLYASPRHDMFYTHPSLFFVSILDSVGRSFRRPTQSHSVDVVWCHPIWTITALC